MCINEPCSWCAPHNAGKGKRKVTMNDENQTTNLKEDKVAKVKARFIAGLCGPFYRMGYGDKKRGIIGAIISALLPYIGPFMVHAYLGLTAEKHLPVDERPAFDMKSAVGLFVMWLVTATIWLGLLGALGNSTGIPACSDPAVVDHLRNVYELKYRPIQATGMITEEKWDEKRQRRSCKIDFILDLRTMHTGLKRYTIARGKNGKVIATFN